MATGEKLVKRQFRAWSMYDWANSAYNLVITSTIFPVYYIAITTDETRVQADHVRFFGWEIVNSSLLNYSIATAYLIIAFLSPILSSIADFQGNKKMFMKFFCYLGALACCGLFFFYPGNVEYGILMSMLAAIGYCGSLVFYNAYLPEIAAPHQQNKLSAQGFAYGYVGSVLLQIICFAFVLYPFADKTFAARLSFLLVGLWWMGFAQVTFKNLPDSFSKKASGNRKWFIGGFQELKKVAKKIKSMPNLKIYLLAFFFYSMGVQTVMLAAAQFGSKEIKKNVNGVWVNMEASDLILTILLIQIVAILGAFIMAKLAGKFGNLRVLMITVFIWILICLSAYVTVTIIEFYFLAVAVGLVMGGIQSLSRSTYSQLMPKTKETASFFSFYDVTEKVAIVIGMFSFGFLENFTGNMRNSILALVLFFFIGMIFLILAELKNKKTFQ